MIKVIAKNAHEHIFSDPFTHVHRCDMIVS